MAFSPDMKAVEKIYFENTNEMYKLAFVHTSISFEASNIVSQTFGNILTNEKAYKKALSSKEGLFSLIYQGCMDFFRRKARKKIKLERLSQMKVPFAIDEGLVELLHLPYNVKAPLVLCVDMNYSPVEAAQIMSCSEKKVTHALERAKKQLKADNWQKAKAKLETIKLSEETFVRNFDILALDYREKGTGFATKLRLRRFKRALDVAVPFIAIGIIALIIIAYLYTQKYH